MKKIILLNVLMSCVLLHGNALSEILFQNVSSTAGISRIGESWDVSWGDFNNDKLIDIWVGNHRKKPSLWINNGDGTFYNIEEVAVDKDRRYDMHSAAWADFDNDGDQDLIESSGGGGAPPFNHTRPEPAFANNFYINSENTLLNQAIEWNVGYRVNRGRGLLWIDVNFDGFLDLVLTGLPHIDGEGGTELFIREADRFSPISPDYGFECGSNGLFAIASEITGDNNVDLLCASEDRIYAYDITQFPFQEIATSLPALDDLSEILAEDFDNDGRIDLFILKNTNAMDACFRSDHEIGIQLLNATKDRGVSFTTDGDLFFDFKTPNPYFIPSANIFLGQGGLPAAVPNTQRRSMSLAVADQNVWGLVPADQRIENAMYIGYDTATTNWDILLSGTGKLLGIVESDALITSLAPINFAFRDFNLTPSMFKNTESGFIDITLDSNFLEAISCESGLAADLDNDMDVDIFLSCSTPTGNSENILYENDGNGVFHKVVNTGGLAGSSLGLAKSAAYADYNDDGFLDIYLTNGRGEDPLSEGPDELFQNFGNTNNWLQVELEGISSNRDATGTIVKVSAGGITQTRVQGGGMHRYAQNQKRLHFGLADYEYIDLLSIQWPNGTASKYRNIKSNQIIHIYEKEDRILDGAPDLTNVKEAGVYLWKLPGEQIFKLVAAGTGDKEIFTVKLISSEPLINVTGNHIESNDNLEPGEFGFTFKSIVWGGKDSVVFQTAPDATTMISVEKNGISNPRFLKVGPHALPLSPVGFIRDLSIMQDISNLQLGDIGGLSLGYDNTNSRIGTQWINTNKRLHRVGFSLFSSTRLSNLDTYALETSDIVSTTLNSVNVRSFNFGYVDGFRVEADGNSYVGIIYEQEARLSPYLIYLEEGRLHQLNAYQIQ